MRGGFHRKSSMTRKSAETALVMLLAGCKVEKLDEFTRLWPRHGEGG
jgi:hypothetical protein